MRARALTIVAPVALAVSLPAAHAQVDAGAPRNAICVENVPQGATRPKITTKFPRAGTSGYAAMLEVELEHGKGETVLLDKLRMLRGTRASKLLEAQGFALPEADGGAPLTMSTEDAEAGARTVIQIPVLLLPKSAGRHELELPALPIDLARAGGEVMTVCTDAHAVTVDEPIANESEPDVRPNPPPRRQREPFDLAKHVAIGLAVGLVVGALALWAYLKHRKKPKPVAAPPPKLPWIEATEELAALANTNLLMEGKTREYIGRLSEILRKYLGGRYAFDGLESTTDEINAVLRRVRPPVAELPRISELLTAFDLVKFARVVPQREECESAHERTLAVVRATTPISPPALARPGVPVASAARGTRRPKASAAARAEAAPDVAVQTASTSAHASEPVSSASKVDAPTADDDARREGGMYGARNDESNGGPSEQASSDMNEPAGQLAGALADVINDVISTAPRTEAASSASSPKVPKKKKPKPNRYRKARGEGGGGEP